MLEVLNQDHLTNLQVKHSSAVPFTSPSTNNKRIVCTEVTVLDMSIW